MTKSKVLASRVVSWELQEQFASFSGDRNPMHMDQFAARRTQAGQPVVHGVHTLLWALDALVRADKIVTPLSRVEVKFLKWIYLDHESVLILPLGDCVDPILLQVEVLGVPVLTAKLAYGDFVTADPEILLAPSPAAPLSRAVERRFADLEGCSGNAYTPATEDGQAFFPRLTALLSGTTVAEIAACSHLVGMEVPGLYSTFSKLDLSLHHEPAPNSIRSGLHFSVSYHDERFRKARISVAGRRICGTLEAFVRQPPVEQASMEEVAAYVTPYEFEGMRALIIGGSRGLGELTAKLIVAGGGKPIISYARGKTEADNVSDQIRRWGGEVGVIQYDVRHSPRPQIDGLKFQPTHLFYFATNAIFRQKGELVSQPILLDFVAFYLQGFHDLCTELLRPSKPHGVDGARLIAYYLSSVALDERPLGMTEYAMVKAAGEEMCRDMNQYLPNLNILVTRLPRLRTDQTASVIPERDLDSIAVMLPIIRQMQSLAASASALPCKHTKSQS